MSIIFFNYKSMKYVKSFLVLLAFAGLSISVAQAQNTYSIVKKGSIGNAYFVYFNGTNLFGGATAAPIQQCIDTIKVEANGNPCTIQFGSGSNALDLGGGSATLITFNGGSSGNDWGEITLTGRATTTANATDGAIYLKNGVSIISNAHITGTEGKLIYNNSSTITVNSDTISLTGSSGYAIWNVYPGTLTVNGGTVRATDNGNAIYSGDGNVTINIISGTVSSTTGCAIMNDFGAVTISGGTISATTGRSLQNSNTSTINISGGTLTSAGDAITNASGVINISGTAKILTTTTGVQSAIYSYGPTGAINISGGEVNGGNSYAIYSSSGGNITVSGGTVTSESDNTKSTIHIDNAVASIEITGGKVLAQEGYAMYIQEGSGAVSGGVVFSYGADNTDIIFNGSYGMLTGNGVIIAWNAAAGTTTYTAGTTDNIVQYPATATAVWAKQSGSGGISYTNGTNTGFIPIEGVTVTGGTGIEETQGIASLQVYPNPVKDVLNFSFEASYKITDLQGRILQESDVTVKSANISNLPTGIYFVSLTTETGKSVKKIIKE